MSPQCSVWVEKLKVSLDVKMSDIHSLSPQIPVSTWSSSSIFSVSEKWISFYSRSDTSPPLTHRPLCWAPCQELGAASNSTHRNNPHPNGMSVLMGRPGRKCTMIQQNNYSSYSCLGRSKQGGDREQEGEPQWITRSGRSFWACVHWAEAGGGERVSLCPCRGHVLGEDGVLRSCRAGGPESGAHIVLWVPRKGNEAFSAQMWCDLISVLTWPLWLQG